MNRTQLSVISLFMLLLGASLHGQAFAESLFIGGITFEVPSEWPETKASSPMRAAQYKIPKMDTDLEDGELAVFFFGEGQGGDTNSNIVRWQEQFKSTDDNTGQIEKKTVNGVSITSVHIEGTYQPSAMSGGTGEAKTDYAFNGAILSGTQGQIFIKLLGPRNTVKNATAAFQKMLDSVQSTLTS